MNFLRKTVLIVLLLSCKYSYSYDITVDVPTDPTDIPSDTIALEEIEITANRLLNFTAGSKIQRINSIDLETYSTSNLSELFSEITPISIKSYGVSGLSNISLRGMNTKHTAVLWNGANLQSSMNGGVDMNSFPTFLIDEISIQYGGSSALFGSGAIGGIIHLISAPQFEKGIDVSYSQNIGSFSNFFEGLKFNFSNSNLASSTRIYHSSGKNDFEFVNTQQFGKPTVKQENSAEYKYGILQSNALKIGTNQKISTNIWAQSHYQEIPSMTTSSVSEQNQYTDILRLSAMYNINRTKSSWYSRIYYNYFSQVYNDPLIDLISEMDTYSFLGELENKTSLGNHFILNTGLSYVNDQVKTPNYGTDKYRNKTALYSSLKLFNNENTFTTIVSIRDEFVDNKLTPFTYSASLNYKPTDFIAINTSYSKNYNLPTFNDLYWWPGGNPDLKEETGWSSDFGIDLQLKSGISKISLDASFFNNFVENMVIWLPTTSSYWTAENVEKLWSSGVETNLKYDLSIQSVKVGIHVFYSYIKSIYVNENINIINALENTISNNYYQNTNDFYGKQLLYTPEHKGGITFSSTYKRFQLRYNHSLVGERYITKDNNSSVDAYHVGNISLGGKFKINTSQLNIHFKINNIWNETYEAMAFYAMPLRYYSISLSYNFNKQLNKI
jgi:outer membrane cobalamin receptor